MMPKLLQYTLAGAVILYLGFIAILFCFQRSLIYPGMKNVVAARPEPVHGLEDWRVPTPDGSIEAFFLPATSSHAGNRQPVMIFAHGNGEVIDFWTNSFNGFRERGIGVLLVEYPGYGRSDGKPSEASIRAAMDAAYDRIVADPRVDRTRIFGMGRSLGGGAICLLSRDRPLRALILQSTFPSLSIFAASYGAPSFLLRDRFDNIGALQSYSGPVLIIHGSKDTLIPWQQAKRLSEVSAKSTFRLYDCGHGCWDPEHLPFWQDVDPFLMKAAILQ